MVWEADRMNLAIIGAGAVGSLLAGYLSPLADVLVVSRRAAPKVQQQKITLRHQDGTETTVVVRVLRDASQVAGWADLALVCVKTFDTPYAAQVATTVLKSDGVALTLQNGLGNVEKLAAVLGENRALPGVSTNGATLLATRTVYHSGVGQIHLATWRAVAGPVRVAQQLFARAGLGCEVTENLEAVLWGKLIINVGINALTAVLGVRNGFLVDVESAQAVLSAAVAEGVAVAQARGVSLPYANPVARVLQVAEATRETRSSMLSDIVRGSRTEIEAINGAIVRLGQELGVSTPVNRTLVQLVQALEAKNSRK